MSVFWSMYHSPSLDSTQARAEARQASSKVEELEARCDRALLVCEALWTVLRDKLGVPEDHLVSCVNDVDLSDGKLDGKVRRPAVACPKCRRNVARRFPKCIYCGAVISDKPFGN